MQTVLTIAGFDPSSGAGVTADMMVFAAHGLFASSCVTALTVQSTVGVESVHPVDPGIVARTLACLDADLPPAGIKIGMIASSRNTISICTYLEKVNQSHSNIPIVLDPVIRSTSGRELLDAEGIVVLRERLLRLADWVTPNLAELAVLTGESVVERADLPRACRILQAQSQAGLQSHARLQSQPRRSGRALGVFATGGHLDPPDDFLLLPDGEGIWLPGQRVVTRATHGTGCALSSAFLSRLVLGDPPQEAARAAKAYVAGALRMAVQRGSGHCAMNHLWNLYKPKV